MPLTYYVNGIYRAISSGNVVIETAGCLRDVRQAGIAEAERSEIVSAFARNPSSGEQIVGTGGACKTRFGGRGKGKSGGCRVISYYAGSDIPVFVLAVFSTGERVEDRKSVGEGKRVSVREYLGRSRMYKQETK